LNRSGPDRSQSDVVFTISQMAVKIISFLFAGYDVRGFPTLFWLPKDTKIPVSYEGGRELPDFIKYIAEKATTELKGWDRKGKEKKQEL
jgi:hypothetical protein